MIQQQQRRLRRSIHLIDTGEEDDIEQLRKEVDQLKDDVKMLHGQGQVVQSEMVRVRHDFEMLSSQLEKKLSKTETYMNQQFEHLKRMRNGETYTKILVTGIVLALLVLLITR